MSARRKAGEGGGGDFELLRILHRGPDEWNKWRRKNRAAKIDFRGAYLPGAILRGAELQYVDLRDADLQGANLRGANLRGAYLQGANLQDAYLLSAYLQGANLRDANFRSASLQDASLQGANPQGANFQKSGLQRASLQHANLRGADLRDADLQGANLRGANLLYANFQGADLRGVNLRSASLLDVDLRAIDLRGANLLRADLRGADLRGADLRGAYFREAYLVRADLRKADLEDANLLDVDLRGVDLHGTNLVGTIFREEKFRIFTESNSIEDADELFECAKSLLEQLGLSVETKNDWRRGFLWQDTIVWLKGQNNRRKLDKRVEIVENVFLGKHDRETTVELAKVAVEFENVFRGKKGAIAIDMGLFIFLRKASEDGDGDTFFKRLTVEERTLLDSDPTLLGDPERLFNKIKHMKKLQAKKAPARPKDGVTGKVQGDSADVA